MLNIGDKAPDFELKDSNSEIIKLSKLKGRYVILYFYPKDMTHGCTKEACNFRDDFLKFKKANVEIIGVSMDNQESHKKFSSNYRLPFKLLVDINGEVCKKYDVYKQKSFFWN